MNTKSAAIKSIKQDESFEEKPREIEALMKLIDIKNPIKYKKRQKKQDSTGRTKQFISDQIFMSINKSDHTRARGKIVVIDFDRFLKVLAVSYGLSEDNMKLFLEELKKIQP